MCVQKIEIRNEVLAKIVGLELDDCEVHNCVLGSAVVVMVTRFNVNKIADVCHCYKGYMNFANEYDKAQLK